MIEGEDQNQQVRVRYKIGDREVEIEGPQHYVDERTAFFLAKFGSGGSDVSGANGISLPPSDSEGLLVGSTSNRDEVDQSTSPISPNIDLVTFYRSKRPKGQTEEVLTIAYWYQIHQGYQDTGVEDFEAGYNELRILAVNPPGSVQSSISNVLKRTDYLFSMERGRYALTIPGKEHVESLPHREANE